MIAMKQNSVTDSNKDFVVKIRLLHCDVKPTTFVSSKR
jgi:hypothetical protein